VVGPYHFRTDRWPELPTALIRPITIVPVVYQHDAISDLSLPFPYRSSVIETVRTVDTTDDAGDDLI